jgi:hypothetical protein
MRPAHATHPHHDRRPEGRRRRRTARNLGMMGGDRRTIVIMEVVR